MKARGPVTAPAGVIVRHTFEPAEAAAFRERCRLARNVEHAAQEAVTVARYTPTGRRRPESARAVQVAVAAWAKAQRVVRSLQAKCCHPGRSFHSPSRCDVCHTFLGDQK